jgi:hypothetical protein
MRTVSINVIFHTSNLSGEKPNCALYSLLKAAINNCNTAGTSAMLCSLQDMYHHHLHNTQPHTRLGTNLTHKSASAHSKTVSLHRNTGKTSMMGNTPAGLQYTLIMQQILQKKDIYLNVSLY